MRELEFLPDWYPQARRRRRVVLLQGWLTVLMIVGMGAYLALMDRKIASAEAADSALRSQLERTDVQAVELDKLESICKQLTQQNRLLSRLGFHVEARTILHTVDALMPKQMSLQGVAFEIDERSEQSAVLAAKGGDPKLDRRLKVKVQGVCPTDVDLANFMTQIAGLPFLEQVNITFAREKSDSGHLMREFEVSFSLNLNVTGS